MSVFSNREKVCDGDENEEKLKICLTINIFQSFTTAFYQNKCEECLICAKRFVWTWGFPYFCNDESIHDEEKDAMAVADDGVFGLVGCRPEKDGGGRY